jgi:hypothetical protein
MYLPNRCARGVLLISPITGTLTDVIGAAYDGRAMRPSGSMTDNFIVLGVGSEKLSVHVMVERCEYYRIRLYE